MTMPTLVQFGAGNIGRGFIAPLFASAGWQVVFVEVAPALVAGLAARDGRYRVIAVDGVHEAEQTIGPVTVVDGRDADAVAAAVAACDLASTSVGLNVLGRLGPVFAQALRVRGRALDVLVCENGAEAHTRLRDAVAQALGADARLIDGFGAVRTSIGRMIPPPAPGADPLDIRVEPYHHLPVERAAFRGPLPQVPDLELAGDFDLILRQKLYLHNLTHAALAYHGHLRGCATIPDAMEHADLVDEIRQAGREACAALEAAHGADAGASSREILDGLLVRYRNRALADPIPRVARDPWRKLASDDRLVGAALLCRSHGLPHVAITRAIAAACRYRPADDEPDAARFRDLAARGPAAVLAAAGLPLGDPLMTAIAHADRIAAFKAALPERRASAARAMRAAGIVLRDDEAEQLEIADFGLGRFAEIGLAIHVYVNTDRVCGKELVMVPGQLCPEHRHPPIDGEPGKEETFRVRQGEVFLYLPGHKQGSGEREAALAKVPKDKHDAFSMFKCVHLKPGDQYTLKPNTPHWFVSGPQGAIVSEFSTKSRDDADIFTDREIVRLPPA